MLTYSKNKTTLDSFIAYCKEHPEDRFWQALRNWSRWKFILVSNAPYYELDFTDGSLRDTFYWENSHAPKEDKERTEEIKKAA